MRWLPPFARRRILQSSRHAGFVPASMTDEVIGYAHTFTPTPDAPALAKAKLLVLTSGDGLAPGMDGLVAKGRKAGGKTVKTPHVATDHGWSDHRIALQAAIMDWLATLK